MTIPLGGCEFAALSIRGLRSVDVLAWSGCGADNVHEDWASGTDMTR
jgi:hypothetical protein